MVTQGGLLKNFQMKHICEFCGHTMTEINSKTIVRDGENRQIIEYVCTNPNCEAPKVVDRPY